MAQTASDKHLFHATALALGDHGVLIQGASGSGKTSLALHLLRRAQQAGRKAALICDDQTYLTALKDEKTAKPFLQMSGPSPIKALIEIRGFAPVPFEGALRDKVRLDLCVNLVEPPVERFQKDNQTALLGVQLPHLVVPNHDRELAGNAIFAALGWSILI